MKYIINNLDKKKLGIFLNNFLCYVLGHPKKIRACRCYEKTILPDTILCVYCKKKDRFFQCALIDVLFAILSVLMLLGFVFFTSIYG